MRLTTKGRFAVTAMLDLALRQDKGPVTLAAISQRQDISLSYLEQLFGKRQRGPAGKTGAERPLGLAGNLEPAQERSLRGVCVQGFRGIDLSCYFLPGRRRSADHPG